MNRKNRVALGLLLLGHVASASAATVDVRILSGGRSALKVPPGIRIEYVALGILQSTTEARLVSTEVEVGVDSVAVLDASGLTGAWLDYGKLGVAASSGPTPVAVEQSGCEPGSMGKYRQKVLSTETVLCHGWVDAPREVGTYRLHLRTFVASAALGPAAFGDWAIVPAGLGRVSDLMIDVVADAPAIVDSYPPAGAVDARQPWSPDGTEVAGWTSLELVFAGDTSQLSPDDFVVTDTGDSPVPQVVAVRAAGPSVVIVLSDMIEPAAWTTITHAESGTSVRVGFLPGDVDGDLETGAADILALIDHLNGRKGRPNYQTDIGRDGQTNGDDLTRLLDLLNGGEGYPVFLGARLPE